MSTDVTEARDTGDGKRLSGGARGLLNDLKLLNEKTTQEMQRGIRESYLDIEGAIALAEELHVEPPRVKRRFHRYFVQHVAYSIAVDAYTEEEADAEAQRLHDINSAYGDLQHASRSRFVNTEGPRAIVSPLTSERPTGEALTSLHRWCEERLRFAAEGRARSVPDHRGEISWTSLVPNS